jgi:hypothetical protein
MNPEDPPAALNYSEAAELHALELRWYKGEMLPYAEWLFAFVARNRAAILREGGAPGDPAALLAATKQLIRESGSLHLASELRDQMREIHNEVWYRGERGEHDRSRIQQEWTSQHAAAWRRWRIKEYLFVVDHCGNRIVAKLLETDDGDVGQTELGL